MPKATKIPGLTDYGDDDNPNAPPKQTVYPKSQGGQMPATTSQGAPTKIPGLNDFGGDTKTAAPASQNSVWYDMFHPTDADLSRPQTWHDWLTKTYSPSASDVGRSALDDVSFGTADYARSKLTGENLADLRARTADAQAAMGPAGPLVNALTYAVPGAGVARGLETIGAAGKVAGTVGRYGAGALEGATANAASSVGHQAGDPNGIDALKVAKDAGTGAVFGVGGQVAGDVGAAAVRNVSNYVRGSPGRGGEQQWDWRTRAAVGDPTVQGEVAISQATLPPDHSAQPALAKVQGALAQSTDPGRMADAIYGTAGTVGGYMGVPPDLALLGGIGGLTAGGVTKQMFGSPGARMINTVDRNINVGQAFDQAYPALYGPQSTPALDTSGWANAVRQTAIGGERPVDQDRDAQWW